MAADRADFFGDARARKRVGMLAVKVRWRGGKSRIK